MDGDRRNTTGTAIILLTLVLAAAAIYFVEVYDAAAGRCGRGDLGACSVVAAEQAQAAALERAREAQAAAVARANATPPPAGSCALGLTAYNMRVSLTTDGCTDFAADHAAPNGSTWEMAPAAPADELRTICVVGDARYGMITVRDSGGAYYGSALCRSLGAH